MSKILSRQRKWQIAHPDKAALLRTQTIIRRRYALLQLGIVKTHEELHDIVSDFERRNGTLSGAEWWNVYEYLDWKYNGSAFTDLKFSAWLEGLT